MSETPSPSEASKRGILVIIVLAIVFLTILTLLLISSGKPPETEQPVATNELYVIPLKLKIRTKPDPKAPVLTTAVQGEKMQLVSEEGAWARVRNEKGITGWTERSSLEVPQDHARRIARNESILKLPPLEGVVEKETPLYSGPGEFYPAIGSLDRGEKVSVYTRDHDFFAITSSGHVAYVSVDAVDLSATEGNARVAVAPETSTSMESGIETEGTTAAE
ncbi:MAG: SH3 domain-containing protein, partial [Thermoanaerobaculia bacterium]